MANSKDHVGLNGTTQAKVKPAPIRLSHVVSFRLSDSKYQQLARMSETCQEGTPSELAREMVCDVLNDGRDEKQVGLSVIMRRLAREVTELQERVTRLIAMLGD
jgi:hypothetical protein